MAYKTYIVDGRQFRTEQDYKDAMYDKELIEKLRAGTADFDASQLKWFLERVQKGEFHFRTLLGQDFEDEISGRIKELEKEKAKPKTPGKGEQSPPGTGAAQKKRTEPSQGQGAAGSKAERSSTGTNAGPSGAARPSTGSTGKGAGVSRTAREKLPDKNPGVTADAKKTGTGRSFSGYTKQQEEALREAVRRELEKREKRRKFFLLLSGILAAAFLGIFGFYAYQERRTAAQNERLGEMIGTPSGDKGRPSGSDNQGGRGPSVTLDGEREAPEVLEEYKTIYNQHKKLIGWLKFDDIDIGGKYGFPVMQTGDNEFFLSHDIEMKEDQNGTIFMDTNCDVLEPSDNFILYGHHMKSGAMFGNLDNYAAEEYWKKYPYIEFDTIYEKGTYQVMYVFRSHVYSEEEIVFKYYQFIDAISEQEFDSYMEEMAEMSLYDTGVTASFGDQLLTLSTCDYQEADGRFVVVAKKVPGREE